ncbi:uncharacterized protein BP5553_09599 [Venustampulla echinocandica]|uniref:Initiation-specific alpha-1,6-mannosyltransferase n=1 Tax=Venustampulla echinocandica TaxID=2656787 RepID=A0A370TBG8_9HELO|nr:uncharacterized protein BP5553_09599 [Venustampulla echinocandica]RDL31390.1 hypothetical protein BP5553_09599 [Venustampulla echinocandica]
MLLSNRPSAFKIFTSTSLITLCIIIVFSYHIWSLDSWKRVGMETVPGRAPLAIGIPEKIWYKLGPKGLNDQSQQWIDTCLKKNPTYKSEFMTDLSGDAYVKKNFAFRPDIVENYLALPIPILKADFLRYLLLLAEGGIWNDLDVSCEEVPIRDWIPAQYKGNASVVVGLEFDFGWGHNFVRQFTSWTLMAKPASPHILMVVDDILEGLREATSRRNVTVAELTLDMIGDVVDFTGPRRLTRSILKSLELTLKDKVDDKNISLLLEPKLIGDVLVLPGYSFASSSNRYKEKMGPALVTHHYAGTWKNDQGGEVA